MTVLAKPEQPVAPPDKQTVEKITWPIDIRLLVAVLGALLYHGVLSIYGTYRNTYDAYVHIFFADHWSRGWFDHWDPRWYTGFTLTSYPPLSQQSVAAVSFLTGDLRLAFALEPSQKALYSQPRHAGRTLYTARQIAASSPP